MTNRTTQRRPACRQAGFTLIETLFAVLLLSVAIAGPLTIAQRGLTATVNAKDQIVAFYLAQDALEWVRFARDTNRLSGVDWLRNGGGEPPYNLSVCTNAQGTAQCKIDTLSGTVTACDAIGCEALRYSVDVNGIGSYSYAGDLSPFTRTVYIQNAPGEKEATLTVEVAWQNIAGITHPPVTLRETLYDWQ